eukprot:scaffold1900_cov123-Cylindrotheca_fusiformis.AAC.4
MKVVTMIQMSNLVQRIHPRSTSTGVYLHSATSASQQEQRQSSAPTRTRRTWTIHLTPNRTTGLRATLDILRKILNCGKP